MSKLFREAQESLKKLSTVEESLKKLSMSDSQKVILKYTELDPKYTALAKVHEMLTAEKIPHLYERFYNGWVIRFTDGVIDEVDGVQHFGSYGESENLIEIIGAITKKEAEQDSVLGYLTAEEVFKRFKYCYKHKTTVYKERGK